MAEFLAHAILVPVENPFRSRVYAVNTSLVHDDEIGRYLHAD